MSEERSDFPPPQEDPPPVPPAQPLDYAPPPVPPPGSAAAVLSCIGGVILAVVVVSFTGVVLAASADPNRNPLSHWPAPVFAAVCIGAVYGAAKSKRAGRMRPFLLGFLITTAVTALLEGICFSAM